MNRRKGILIVDDNEDLRAVAREVLTSEGYRVRAVARAEAALRLLQNGEEPIDLVVTNAFFPGMTGIDLADRLRAEGRNVRIVLTSSQVTHPDLQDRLARGDVAFLTRPFSIEGLTDKVDRSLRSPEPAGSGHPPEESGSSDGPGKKSFLPWLLSRRARS